MLQCSKRFCLDWTNLDADRKRVPSPLVDPTVGAAIDSLPNRVTSQGFSIRGVSPQDAKFYLAGAACTTTHARRFSASKTCQRQVRIVPIARGSFPFDGICRVAALLKASPPRLVRAMAERWSFDAAVCEQNVRTLGRGAGRPDNRRNLLEDDQAILVFRGSARVRVHFSIAIGLSTSVAVLCGWRFRRTRRLSPSP